MRTSFFLLLFYYLSDTRTKQRCKYPEANIYFFCMGTLTEFIQSMSPCIRVPLESSLESAESDSVAPSCGGIES